MARDASVGCGGCCGCVRYGVFGGCGAESVARVNEVILLYNLNCILMVIQVFEYTFDDVIDEQFLPRCIRY